MTLVQDIASNQHQQCRQMLTRRELKVLDWLPVGAAAKQALKMLWLQHEAPLPERVSNKSNAFVGFWAFLGIPFGLCLIVADSTLVQEYYKAILGIFAAYVLISDGPVFYGLHMLRNTTTLQLLEFGWVRLLYGMAQENHMTMLIVYTSRAMIFSGLMVKGFVVAAIIYLVVVITHIVFSNRCQKRIKAAVNLLHAETQ